MGVGYPVDLVVCVALGVDMFDCVYPARTARFGVALTDDGNMQLKNKKFKADLSPIEKDCACATCQHFTRAYLHCVASKEQTGARLVTIHNIAYMMRLGRRMREAIRADTFPAFVVDYFSRWYPRGDWPRWCVDALARVNIHLPCLQPGPPSELDPAPSQVSLHKAAAADEGGREEGTDRAPKRGEKRAERAEKKRQRKEQLVASATPAQAAAAPKA